MEGRTRQNTTNDKTEEFNDTLKDDQRMNNLIDLAPEVLTTAENNTTINNQKFTFSQLSVTSDNPLSVNNDNTAVLDSQTALKKSSSSVSSQLP